jgi:1-acyl-sn-glycerol-3-phosphate acyltransferase
LGWSSQDSAPGTITSATDDNVIRSLLFPLYALAITPFYASRALWAARFGSNPACTCEAMARRWSRRLLKAAGVTVEVTGMDELPRDEPRIIVANHQSWFDVFAMAGFLPVGFRFVAKAELSKIPIFGPAWIACGHVSIDRNDRVKAVQSMDEAGERMKKENLTIALFPEGTRSEDGRLKPFKKGAFVLAIQSGVPVVPVAVLGSYEVMPKGRWRIRPGRIELRVGEPIPVEGLDLADRDALLQSAWSAVRRLKGEEEITADNAA